MEQTNQTRTENEKLNTAATLFSGVGGGSLALQWNNIKEVVAIDNWAIAQKAFEANFKDEHFIPFWQANVLELTAENLLRRMLMQKKELDLMLLSPPCQGFSVAKGKLDPLDPRNALFLKGMKLISGVAPKCFIIENVPGMTDPRNVPIFNEIKYRFREELMPDYEIKCFKLCSLNHHTPQKRNRLIFIGYLKSFQTIPTPPAPDIAAQSNLRIKDVTPEVTAIKVGQSKKTIKHNTEFMTTITATGGITVYSNGVESKLDREQNRKFAGFPDWFKIPADISDRDAQKLFGNTIPPHFMKDVVAHILTQIGHQFGGNQQS